MIGHFSYNGFHMSTEISAKTSRFVSNFTSDKRSEVGELFSGPSGLLPEMSDGPETIREHCSKDTTGIFG